MPRYLAKVAYDGTCYIGYQKQSCGQTIQNAIENVISRILNTSITIYASGRTDAGVHATGQTFHFDSPKELDTDRFIYSINCLLPKDIHLISLILVDDAFHARLSAIAKKYVYRIHQGLYSPFLNNYAYQLNKCLNVKNMQNAANTFIGEHNFQNFTSKEEDERNFVRMIYVLQIEKKNQDIEITIIGNGFMRYMIRMIVGTLVAIGQGKESIDFVKNNIDNQLPRRVISYKAPAQGLFLEKVFYKELMDVNYHTHTSRCGHASGSDEEYVLSAIKAGVKHLGFSDHIFYPDLKNEPFENVRGDYSLMDDYLNSLTKLKEKYRDQITIEIGFEAEYYPDYEWYYRDLVENKKVDYLILGQHFIRENGVTSHFLFDPQDKKGIRLYCDALIRGMKTGVYRYVAHPDLYMAGYEQFDETAQSIAREICQASLEYDIPLEINLGGLRKGLHTYEKSKQKRFLYPHYDFWKVVSEYGCKVVIGVDAHCPKDFTNEMLFLAMDLIEKLHLNYVTKIG